MLFTYLAISSDLSDDSKDLVTDIIGVQVSSFLGTIKDANIVQYFSYLSESDSKSLHDHDWSFKPDELCDLIAETLCERKYIVF